MKQKRKVKSLIIKNQDKRNFILTVILLILSLVLCIGTATIITSTALAADGFSNGKDIQYDARLEHVEINTELHGGDFQLQQVNNPERFNPSRENPRISTINPNYPIPVSNTPSNNGKQNLEGFSYSGLDNNIEVLYEMRFVDPSNLIKIVGEIYIKGNSLYIGPVPVIVNPSKDNGDIDRNSNVISGGLYSNILGGKNNKVYSDNMTLIAGEGNYIHSGNDNVLILGGDNNTIYKGGKLTNEQFTQPGGGEIASTSTTESLSVGGNLNEIGSGHLGVGMIGGSENKTLGKLRNSFILGGKENTIISSSELHNRPKSPSQYLKENGNINVIVGGQNNNIDSIDHVFVYSNSDETFEPKTSKAFYLNMNKGVGINTEGKTEGLAVGGAVNLSSINSLERCDNNNLGIIVSLDGCLLGCTKAGATDSKWELLDRGEGCQLKTKEKTDIIEFNESENEEIVYDTYEAKCTTNINTGNATICSVDGLTGGYVQFYKNVIFETSLIDSEANCPKIDKWENQCVYKCNTGYHLVGGTCYADCTLPWPDENGNSIGISHNQTVTGYNIEYVSCSNSGYKFPLDTFLINTGSPALFPKGIIKGTNNKAQNGYSPETCTNYEHQKTLKCRDGTLYLVDNGGNIIKNSSGLASDYKYSGCNLQEYECDRNVYNLTQLFITGTVKDAVSSGWNNKDRSITTGDKGVYKLCLDWEPSNGGNESCSTGNVDNKYHYQLLRCKTGYSTGTDNNPYECRKDCTLKSSTGLDVSYKHNYTITGYVSTGVRCAGICDATKLVCNDGDRRLLTKTGAITTKYGYNSCQLFDEECEGYNVTGATYNQWSETSIYSFCDSYTHSGQFSCNPGSTKYKLEGCQSGYHALGNIYCDKNREIQSCSPKPANSHWIWGGGPVRDYPGYKRFGNLSGLVSSGQYVRRWSGAWDATNGWSNIKYPKNQACVRDCDEYYHQTGTKCDINTCKGNTPTSSAGDVVYKGDGKPSVHDTDWTYMTGKQSNLESCEWSCKNGYHKIGNNTCVQNSCFSNGKPTGAGVISGGLHPTGYANTGWKYKEGKTQDQLSACEWSCKTGYVHSGNACVEKTCKTNSAHPNPPIRFVNTGASKYVSTDDKYWTYTGSDTPTTDIKLGACEWTCKKGYYHSGNTCTQKTCKSPIPSGSHIKTGASKYTTAWQENNHPRSYTGAKKPGACEWTCETNNYKPNSAGTGCIEYECIGLVPDNAHLITGSDRNIIGADVTRTVYENKNAANGKKCAYLCNSGFHVDVINGIRVCADDVYNSVSCNGRQGYIPSSDGDRCNRLGYCRYNNSIFEKTPENGKDIRYNQSRPIGDYDKDWICVSGTPVDNQCQYECKSDFGCINGKCVPAGAICPSKTNGGKQGGPTWARGTYNLDKTAEFRVVGNGGDKWKYDQDGTNTADGCYFKCITGTEYGIHPKNTSVIGCIPRMCASLPSYANDESIVSTKENNPNQYNQGWEFVSNLSECDDNKCCYTCDEEYIFKRADGKIGCKTTNPVIEDFCPSKTDGGKIGEPTWARGTYDLDKTAEFRVEGKGGNKWEYDQNETKTGNGCYFKCISGSEYGIHPDNSGVKGCIPRMCASLPSYANDESIVSTKENNPNQYNQGWEFVSNLSECDDNKCCYTCDEEYIFERADGKIGCKTTNPVINPVIEDFCPSKTDGGEQGEPTWLRGTYHLDETAEFRVKGKGGNKWEYDQDETKTEDGCYFKCISGSEYGIHPERDNVIGCIPRMCASLPSYANDKSIVSTKENNPNQYKQGWEFVSNLSDCGDNNCCYTCEEKYKFIRHDGKIGCMNVGNDECKPDDGLEFVGGECVSICDSLCTNCGWNTRFQGCIPNKIPDVINNCSEFPGNNWKFFNYNNKGYCIVCPNGKNLDGYVCK